MEHRRGAGFDTAVIGVDCGVASDLGIGEALGLLFGDEYLDILTQRSLVAFQRQDVIGALVEDRLGDIPLAAHGIDGHDRPSMASMLSNLGIATISLDFPATLTWPSTRR